MPVTAPAASSDLVKIAEIVQADDLANTFDFLNIPQTYKHLRLVIMGRCAQGAYNRPVGLQFNGDTTSTYSAIDAYTTGAAPAGESHNSLTLGHCGQVDGQAPVGGGVLARNSIEVSVPFYRDTTWNKTWHSDSENFEAFTTALLMKYVGHWAPAAAVAISRITVLIETSTDKWKAGSTATLYGLK